MPLLMQGVDTAYCVPYSMWGIAQYFAIDIDVENVMLMCGTHKKQGSHHDIFVPGMQKIGLKFRRLRFNYPSVLKSLAKGNPVTICYMISDTESHFSTIIGARQDERGLNFYTLNDTYYGRYEIPEDLLKVLMKIDESWARTVEKI